MVSVDFGSASSLLQPVAAKRARAARLSASFGPNEYDSSRGTHPRRTAFPARSSGWYISAVRPGRSFAATGHALQSLIQSDGQPLSYEQGSAVQVELPAEALRVLRGSPELKRGGGAEHSLAPETTLGDSAQ